ncbi:hypothetical protein [Lentibacillus amyloliquefaciens]|uniref:hypothetical protein n=1 Tax=Lentibacillus amyloliquefaciens TaxID=1472767 RepID=UPI0012E388D2|nr:hypothetical protein [Lentibacillus amyloliquefaciens]
MKERKIDNWREPRQDARSLVPFSSGGLESSEAPAESSGNPVKTSEHVRKTSDNKCETSGSCAKSSGSITKTIKNRIGSVLFGTQKY